MNFNTDFIDQFSGFSKPFPVELTKACDWLGVIDRYETLKMVKTYFRENIDYEVNGTLYFLTVSCLQELAMLARTPQGRAARLYFLECERIAKSVTGEQAQKPAPPEEFAPVMPAEAQLHAMRTRESERLELAALPVSQKKTPKFRRAVDIARDRAAKIKEEVIDW